MKKLFSVLVMILVLFLVGCSGEAVTDDYLYDEAITILEDEYEPYVRQNGFEVYDYSSQAMTSIEEIGDNLYELKGGVFFTDDTGLDFTVKIHVGKDEIEYEWAVE